MRSLTEYLGKYFLVQINNLFKKKKYIYMYTQLQEAVIILMVLTYSNFATIIYGLFSSSSTVSSFFFLSFLIYITSNAKFCAHPLWTRSDFCFGPLLFLILSRKRPSSINQLKKYLVNAAFLVRKKTKIVMVGPMFTNIHSNH